MENLKQSYKDEFGREFGSLRVSLTQACNFQCVYCVPQGLTLKKLPTQLSAQQLFFLVTQLLNACKIKKLRLTGGEPLLYQGLADFLNLTAPLALEKSITTNGVLLEKNLDLLWESGYRKINISLDALQPENFRQLARRQGLNKVLDAIEKALQIGFSLKLNVVPMKSLNEDQLLPLLDFCLQRNIECRYIELMQMGHITEKVFGKYFLSMQDILNKISTKYTFSKVSTSLSATAQRFEVASTKGAFGIIPNYSAPFCEHCNRLRLTSDGKLYGCISNTANQSLKYLLDLPPEDCQRELSKILPLTLKSKQKKFTGVATFMQEIGG